jgi:hypothetical protein
MIRKANIICMISGRLYACDDANDLRFNSNGELCYAVQYYTRNYLLSVGNSIVIEVA